jgi:hypothetical protein
MTQLISVLEGKNGLLFQEDGRKPTPRTQLPYFNSYFVSILLGVAFDHRDLQTFSGRLLSAGISQRKNLF